MKDGNKKCVETIRENSKTGEKVENLQLSNLDQSNSLIKLYLVICNYINSLFFLFLKYRWNERIEKSIFKILKVNKFVNGQIQKSSDSQNRIESLTWEKILC